MASWRLARLGRWVSAAPRTASILAPAKLALSSGSSLPAAGQGEALMHNDNRSTNFYGDIHDTNAKQQAEKVKQDRAKNQIQPIAEVQARTFNTVGPQEF